MGESSVTISDTIASTTDWKTEGATAHVVRAVCWAINITGWLIYWVYSLTGKGLTIIGMSIYGAASVVTTIFLGCQTFFSADKVRGRLKDVSLELYAWVKEVVSFDDSMLIVVLTLLPDSPLLNLGETSESSTHMGYKGLLPELYVGGGANYRTRGVSLSWIDLIGGTIFALLLYLCCLKEAQLSILVQEDDPEQYIH